MHPTSAKMFHLFLRGKQNVTEVGSQASLVYWFWTTKQFLTKACVSNYRGTFFKTLPFCACPALPTRKLWSWGKRVWCSGDLGMCFFKSSTDDVRITAFWNLSLSRIVLARSGLMALKAVFHLLAKGIFPIMLSDLTLFILLFCFMALTTTWHYIMYPFSCLLVIHLSH